MKKTLLEHHYELRIDSLRDDPSVSQNHRQSRWLEFMGGSKPPWGKIL